MIKSFTQFNESKSIHFEESDEFKSVMEKNRLSDSTIKDYFTDLIDERGFEIEINCRMGIIEGGIKIYYQISVVKNIQNPTEKNSIKANNYLNFLNEQVKDIHLINECISRLSQSEDLNFDFNNMLQVPFWGAGNNSKDSSEFNIVIQLTQEIETNDLNIARDKFEKTDSPIKQAYDKIVKILKDNEVVDAERLIDTQDIEEYEYMMFGFLTNDEIIVIADYHYNDPKVGVVIHNHELERAIKYYKNGQCNEYL